ncbi:MAG: transporter substrate-binding domain-containing protein [Burkholderiales bacterium]
MKPNFIDTAWAGVIPSLYAKKFDIVMSAMSYTKERLERVAFSIPYAEASQAMLIRSAEGGEPVLVKREAIIAAAQRAADALWTRARAQ